jgi:hypothetical protein
VKGKTALTGEVWVDRSESRAIEASGEFEVPAVNRDELVMRMEVQAEKIQADMERLKKEDESRLLQTQRVMDRQRREHEARAQELSRELDRLRQVEAVRTEDVARLRAQLAMVRRGRTHPSSLWLSKAEVVEFHERGQAPVAQAMQAAPTKQAPATPVTKETPKIQAPVAQAMKVAPTMQAPMVTARKVEVIMETDWGGWAQIEVEEGTSAVQLLERVRRHWNRPSKERLRIAEKTGPMEVRAGAKYEISRMLPGMARVIQDQLQVWFEDWTYCLDGNGLWKVTGVDWTGGQVEYGAIQLGGERIRIDFRGQTYWLYEDGHWEYGDSVGGDGRR